MHQTLPREEDLPDPQCRYSGGVTGLTNIEGSGTAGWKVFDSVHRSGVDPGSQYPARRAGGFGFNGLNK